jgi:hypothetical protein
LRHLKLLLLQQPKPHQGIQIDLISLLPVRRPEPLGLCPSPVADVPAARQITQDLLEVAGRGEVQDAARVQDDRSVHPSSGLSGSVLASRATERPGQIKVQVAGVPFLRNR